jgi:hypothetical protein
MCRYCAEVQQSLRDIPRAATRRRVVADGDAAVSNADFELFLTHPSSPTYIAQSIS